MRDGEAGKCGDGLLGRKGEVGAEIAGLESAAELGLKIAWYAFSGR